MDITHLPSPEKKPSVFVFHEDTPEVVSRVPLNGDGWEVFLEMVRSRLCLRTSEVIMDAATGERSPKGRPFTGPHAHPPTPPPPPSLALSAVAQRFPTHAVPARSRPLSFAMLCV
jgi:hypothetical protein